MELLLAIQCFVFSTAHHVASPRQVLQIIHYLHLTLRYGCVLGRGGGGGGVNMVTWHCAWH